MSCVYCNMTMHELCASFDKDPCCCDGKGFQGEAVSLKSILRGPNGGAKWSKDPALMADPTSAGRKRAAVEIPDGELNGEKVCEWAGLLFAGGGVEPVIGCSGRIASDRHHGPDKCVLNNKRGVNLWAICDWCHNRWHAMNDKYYVPEGWRSSKLDGDPRPKGGDPWLPNPEYEWSEPDTSTFATPEYVAMHEAWWAMSNYQRNEVLGGNFREYAKRLTLGSPGTIVVGTSGHSSDQDASSGSGTQSS